MELTEEEIMYHVTRLEHVDSILKYGLMGIELAPVGLAGPLPPFEKGIYLSRTLEEAEEWVASLAIPTDEEWKRIKKTGEPVVIKMAILEVRVPAGYPIVRDPDVIEMFWEDYESYIVGIQKIEPDRIRLLDVREMEVG